MARIERLRIGVGIVRVALKRHLQPMRRTGAFHSGHRHKGTSLVRFAASAMPRGARKKREPAEAGSCARSAGYLLAAFGGVGAAAGLAVVAGAATAAGAA